MDFCEITEVVPWDRCAFDCGQNLNDPQKFKPRIFKSHECYESIPKGGKYVYVARNPLEVVVSKYEFLLSVARMSASEVPFDEFFLGNIMSGSDMIWDHYLSFIKQRDNPNILWVFYEDLLQDREKCIVKIAEFANIPLDDELKRIATQQTSFQFMKEHNNKFDDNFVLGFAWRRINETLPPAEQIDISDARANKVHKGGGGTQRIQLSTEQLRAMDNAWTQVIASATGIGSYDALRTQFSVLLS